jgi:hypothetical protein
MNPHNDATKMQFSGSEGAVRLSRAFGGANRPYYRYVILSE